MPRRPDIELDLRALDGLVKKASAKRLTVKAALNSGKFAAVGFGLFRDNEDSIWKVQESSDGTEYIVRADETTNIVESDGDWSTVSDKARENITLSYKNTPVYRFASVEFGFEPVDAQHFAKYLLKRTKNAEFLRKLNKIAVNDQSSTPRHPASQEKARMREENLRREQGIPEENPMSGAGESLPQSIQVMDTSGLLGSISRQDALHLSDAKFLSKDLVFIANPGALSSLSTFVPA